MHILSLAGKASIRVLKTAASFAAGTVVAFFVFYVLVFLPSTLRKPSLLLGRFAVRSLMVVAFAGGFYLTFKLLEPRIAARKGLLIAIVGIVLLPASVFVLFFTPTSKPTLGIVECFRCSSPPDAPKPYEEAIYDVYSGLIIEEGTQGSLWEKLVNPLPRGVLIRIDTAIGAPGPGSALKPVASQEYWDKSVVSAMADYARRSKEPLHLQRKFDLPKYDLITTAEEEAVLKSEGDDQDGSRCLEFTQKHPGYSRWVDLSAVGFNEDQTVAVVYIAVWRGSSPQCRKGIFGYGGPRYLYKRNGRWHLMKTDFFADWTT